MEVRALVRPKCNAGWGQRTFSGRKLRDAGSALPAAAARAARRRCASRSVDEQPVEAAARQVEPGRAWLDRLDAGEGGAAARCRGGRRRREPGRYGRGCRRPVGSGEQRCSGADAARAKRCGSARASDGRLGRAAGACAAGPPARPRSSRRARPRCVPRAHSFRPSSPSHISPPETCACCFCSSQAPRWTSTKRSTRSIMR